MASEITFIHTRKRSSLCVNLDPDILISIKKTIVNMVLEVSCANGDGVADSHVFRMLVPVGGKIELSANMGNI